jgi:AraC family transcriptional regulator
MTQMTSSRTPKTPAPLFRHHVKHTVISQFGYDGGGFAEVPALPGDQLSVTLSGANVLERCLDGRRERGVVAVGDMTLVPRGVRSSWQPQEGASSVVQLFILPTLWASVAKETGINPERVELRGDFATSDPLVEQLVRALATEATSAWFGGQLYGETLELALALHLLRHYSSLNKQNTKAPTTANLSYAVDYIEAHLNETLSLEVLAALGGLSPYHFARTFKKVMGQPPHQYIIRQRVKRAQQLLSTHLSLAEIALDVGFANQSHLNRHFKSLLQLTPQQYRAQLSARSYYDKKLL